MKVTLLEPEEVPSTEEDVPAGAPSTQNESPKDRRWHHRRVYRQGGALVLLAVVLLSLCAYGFLRPKGIQPERVLMKARPVLEVGPSPEEDPESLPEDEEPLPPEEGDPEPGEDGETEEAGESGGAPASGAEHASTGAETLDAEVEKVLASIITEGMTRQEQARAIFDFTRKGIAYTGKSDKSDWKNGAYIGLTTRRGDCFTYYAVSRALLTALGIDNLEVTRVGGPASHYWNLVNCGDGWYHFDATPRSSRLPRFVSFMFTDQQAADYTRRAGRNYYTFDGSLYPERAEGPASSSGGESGGAAQSPAPAPKPPAAPPPAETAPPADAGAAPETPPETETNPETPGDADSSAGPETPPEAPGDANVSAGPETNPETPGDTNVSAGPETNPETPGDMDSSAGPETPPETPGDTNDSPETETPSENEAPPETSNGEAAGGLTSD